MVYYLLNRLYTGSWICCSSLGANWLVWGRALWLKEWKNFLIGLLGYGPNFWVPAYSAELYSSPEAEVLWRLPIGISNL